MIIFTTNCKQEYWSGLPFLLQGIFPTQELNLRLPHCRQILYLLSSRGSLMRVKALYIPRNEMGILVEVLSGGGPWVSPGSLPESKCLWVTAEPSLRPWGHWRPFGQIRKLKHGRWAVTGPAGGAACGQVFSCWIITRNLSSSLLGVEWPGSPCMRGLGIP